MENTTTESIHIGGDAGGSQLYFADSVAIGYQAFDDVGTNSKATCYSVGIGYQAVKSIYCNGCGSVAIGYQAAFDGSSSLRKCCYMVNTDIGYRAGAFTDASTAQNYGCANTRIGYCAASQSLCNHSGVVIGAMAACCLCRQSGQVYIGMQAGVNNKDPFGNIAIGCQAQMCGFRPHYSIYIGGMAGYCAGYGCNSIYIGQCAGCKAYYSRYSVTVGHRAFCTSGCRNCYGVTIGALANANTYCGQYSVAIGFCAACANYYTRCSLYLGAASASGVSYSSWACNEQSIGYGATGNGNNTATIGNGSTTKINLRGPISKGGGSFRIVHPNPKKKSKWLNHSFVESPTAGDNIYRWTVDVCNCEHSMPLPEYYKYLNENNMAWVKPLGHFGEAYAEVDSKEENLIIKSNKDGKYNILLVGTRKDEDAARAWNGVEEDMTESDILSNKNRIEEDVVKIN